MSIFAFEEVTPRIPEQNLAAVGHFAVRPLPSGQWGVEAAGVGMNFRPSAEVRQRMDHAATGARDPRAARR